MEGFVADADFVKNVAEHSGFMDFLINIVGSGWNGGDCGWKLRNVVWVKEKIR